MLRSKTTVPETFSRQALNDLTRDLGLPNREEEFRQFFNNDDEKSVVYYSNAKGLVDELKPNT